VNQPTTTSTPDARAELAKMDAAELAAATKVAQLAEAHEEKRRVLLAQVREADLADVIKKISDHKFTATDLRSVLKAKGARKTAPRKSTARKTTRRKAS